MRLLVLICISIFLGTTTFSQTQPPVYRSAFNPHYWKNNPPHAAYWQQDVAYKIEATIDDENDIINGTKYEVEYWNNSPDTLNEIFFHLYQEAFQPGSHYDNLQKNNDVIPNYGPHEQKGLGTEIEGLKVDGEAVTLTQDNTILRATLNQPLLPGSSITITMQFKTYFDNGGNTRRRMTVYETHGYKHFNGVHWYPSICVYDHKFGWTTEQHLDKEFYADFGSFDVKFTFPQEYILEATGLLQNKDEVLPDDLREKLDMQYFVDNPVTKPEPVTPPEEGKTKTWHYFANNVHNFAFTADPLYCIDDQIWNDIRVVAIAQQQHAKGWIKSAEYTKDVIKTYSEDFGMYAWPKIVVADAKDGMEYPMLTLDNGSYPGHQGLLSHEVGHMWFYGMLGTNEAYRAFMDEGFTQFLTAWSLDAILGEERNRYFPTSKFFSKYLAPFNNKYYRCYYYYLIQVYEGYDQPLNTHSSDFEGALRHGGGYGLVYYKTATMLYNLKYVLGDALFMEAMQHYFNKWKMAHPYPEDFRDAIIEYTHVDLNWFFDQWLETTKYTDYAIDKVKKGKEPGTYEISFKRKGEMQMPLDFIVSTKSGEVKKYHIPNTWFIKKTDAETLPKWYGWGEKLHPEYTATITIDGELETVEIDPERRLADIDLTNNTYPRSKFCKWEMDYKVPDAAQWKEKPNYIRPDIWYNSYDGFQIGLHLEGNYFQQKNFYDFNIWYNSRLAQRDIEGGVDDNNNPVSFEFSFRDNLRKVWRNFYVNTYAAWNAGLGIARIGLEKKFQKQDQRNPKYTTLFANLQFMNRFSKTDTNYLIYPQHWSTNAYNNTFNVGISRHYRSASSKVTGDVRLELTTPGFGSDFGYSYLELEAINDIQLGKFDISTRVYGRYGDGFVAPESQLYLAGANPEAMYANRFTRAAGLYPDEWMGYGNETNSFHFGGGLNLRGYAGYYATTDTGDSTFFNFVGNSGAALNVEIEFDEVFHIKRARKNFTKHLHLDLYAFGDVGLLTFFNEKGKQEIGDIKMDAGLGSALTIRWGFLQYKPLVVRFDVPFFVSAPPPSEDNLEFRFVVGVERAF